ncbi:MULTISPECIES: hypothetical protein [Bacillaceae]|uniref:Uncharacterized protein n=1 Tax=Evansella alkalicola TaxID=745819 RepID=A0ABS6JRC7_9BACI|nr:MULTISPECIES: hypothetical protein [Bacillaceae]MBU9720269.1 hypothetical protein [Bacillus alkalicola]
MWIVIMTIITTIIIHSIETHYRIRPPSDTAEVGEQKVEGGYLWYNLGDSYGNEYWSILDYVGPTYYIEVCKKEDDDSVHLFIHDEPVPDKPVYDLTDHDSLDYCVACDGEKDVERNMKRLNRIHSLHNEVVIDDGYDELMKLKDKKVSEMKALKEVIESQQKHFY